MQETSFIRHYLYLLRKKCSHYIKRNLQKLNAKITLLDSFLISTCLS